MRPLRLGLAVALTPLLAIAGDGGFALHAKVKLAAIDEMSGIVKSRTHPDTWWVHNDSGDSARIFAINGEGEVIFPGWLARRFSATDGVEGKAPWPGHALMGATHYDYEDIATDGERLYICDLGNNGNARRDLGIWVLMEPNPRAIDRARPLSFWPVSYPDQAEFPARDWHFDCEAVFFDDGKLYLLTKHRQDQQINVFERGTKLYRLDAPRPDRVTPLTLVDAHAELFGPTAADLSPDGARLAVLGFDGVAIFPRPASGDAWLSGEPQHIHFLPGQYGQAEGLCWDSETQLRLTNEAGQIFLLDTGPAPTAPRGRKLY